MDTSLFDVVIVGASFSGLTLAHHLPRTLRVLLVDGKPSAGSTVESTGLITVRTRQLFTSFVDIDRFITNPMTAVCVMAPGWKDTFFSHTSDPWIFQTDTRALVKHLADTLPPNVTFRPSTTYIGSHGSPIVSSVTLLTNNERYEVGALFLVGADGSRSRVAAATRDLDVNTSFLYGVEQVYLGDILLGDHPAQTIYHIWFGAFSLGYGGWLSPTTHEGKPAVRIGLAKHAQDRGDAARLMKAFIRELHARGYISFDERAAPVFQFGGMIPIGGARKRIHAGNVLTIGDAAGLCGAFAADGIKGSLVSGIESAPLITRWLEGDVTALSRLHARIDTHDSLMHYYRKQVLYRWVWDQMKRDRTFRAMFDIIAREHETFLNQFCDSKDRKKSLARMVLRWKHLPFLLRYAFWILIDIVIPPRSTTRQD